jgi:hypothetical protein
MRAKPHASKRPSNLERARKIVDRIERLRLSHPNAYAEIMRLLAELEERDET